MVADLLVNRFLVRSKREKNVVSCFVLIVHATSEISWIAIESAKISQLAVLHPSRVYRRLLSYVILSDRKTSQICIHFSAQLKKPTQADIKLTNPTLNAFPLHKLRFCWKWKFQWPTNTTDKEWESVKLLNNSDLKRCMSQTNFFPLGKRYPRVFPP